MDPGSAQKSSEPGATLAGYRADARLHGGITFGVNAIIVGGQGFSLRSGQSVAARWRFA